MNSESQSPPQKKQFKIRWLFCLLGGISLGTAFGLYLWSLYHQLTVAFDQQKPFVPTRIYSDLTQLKPGMLLSSVQNHLKSRGYAYTASTNLIQFNLHPIDYPSYLLPEGHPILAEKNRFVSMNFIQASHLNPSASLAQASHQKSPWILETIQLGGTPIPDLYLEPELIATLSRSSEQPNETKKEIRTFLKFEEIPANVWKAIIAIEDQHFLEHRGLDPRGVARAIWVNLKTLSLAQGGSTLTQQLVKNLMARHSKNLIRKINELFLSLLLEARFDKERILERYLNEVYLGQVGNLEVHGVAEGAQHFFGKKLEDLNLGEIALMAGLIRGPGYYSPYRYHERAIERQRLVLKKMVETEQIAEAEAEAAIHLPIRLIPPQTVTTRAPFFTDYVKAELGRLLKSKLSEQDMIQAGFKVYTTLDSELNSLAQRSVTEGIQRLETRFKFSANSPLAPHLEGALACVDHSKGYLRALVGGRSYSRSNFNRILNMKRQVGSTFKPIVYLTALQKGEDPHGIPYGPAHPVEDAPWTLVFDHGRQTWTPKNYENNYLGWISLRTALAQSINTVASKLGYEVGLDAIIHTGHALGIQSDLPAVPSLALGVAELSPIELLKVYATLANHGIQGNLTVIRAITENDGKDFARYNYQPTEVFNAAPIDLTTDLLQSVFKEGTARAAQTLGFNRPAAGKTGTTSNHRDAWFAGYTPQLTTVVWVGMDSTDSQLPASGQGSAQFGTKASRPPVQLTGANSALPIWVNFMNQALLGEPALEFSLNPKIVTLPIDRHSGKAASGGCSPDLVISEKYIQGHEPKEQACGTQWPASEPKTESPNLFPKL